MTDSRDSRDSLNEGGPIDLVTLDGRVARAAAGVDKALARLSTREGREEAHSAGGGGGGDPFGALRDVAVQSTFRTLAEQKISGHEEEHRQALLRWVHELLQTRVAWELIVAEADAMHALDPALPKHVREPSSLALAPTTPADSDTTSPKTTVTKSYDEALRSLIETTHPTRTAAAMQRLDDLAAPVASVRKELRARRLEAARRLGLAHPWSRMAEGVETPPQTLAKLAKTLLDATEPLAIEKHKELKRSAGGGGRAAVPALTPAALSIDDGFGREAREGWPSHLSTRWLEDVFKAITPRPPQHVHLPSPLGGASFLRAASAWGIALRFGGVARSLPFALARDPYPIEAHAFGGVLAMAVADRVFARKRLGLPARSADAHARSLGRVLFTEIRRIAAAALLVDASGSEAIGNDLIEELGARVFGSPLPKALGLAWAYGGGSFANASGSWPRAVVSAPTRLLGALRAHGLVRLLIDRFDEDWFENPRTGAHLSAMSVGPVWIPSSEILTEPTVATTTTTIARGFEELIG